MILYRIFIGKEAITNVVKSVKFDLLYRIFIGKEAITDFLKTL